jgi:catalase
MDICLYHSEIGTCPLSFARNARTFADFIHSASPPNEDTTPMLTQKLCESPETHIKSKE